MQKNFRHILRKLSFYFVAVIVLGFLFSLFIVTNTVIGKIKYNLLTVPAAKMQELSPLNANSSNNRPPLKIKVEDSKSDAAVKRRTSKAKLERMFALTSQLLPPNNLSLFVAPTVTASKTDSLVATPNNGDGKADPGDTIGYTVTISASGMDATDVMFNDSPDMNTMLTGNVLTTPIARNDSYTATGNIRIQIPAGSGLLINDNDADGIGPAITATAQTVSSTNCAGCNNVVINADGSFSYNPPVGFEGTDTFTYTLNDNEGNTDTATVSITVSGMIWFINNNAASCTTIAAGCGRLTNPFSTLAAFEAVNGNAGASNPAANEPVFIYESATSYTGPVTLENGQRFIGQDAAGSLVTLAGITLAPNSDALPTTNSVNATIVTITTGDPAITLGQNNTLRGFTGGNSTTDIGGTSFGTLTIADVTLNDNGRALNLSTGTLAANFAGISSNNSSTTGITLSGVGGSLVSGSTIVTNPTNAGISVASSSATFSFGNTTSNQSGGAGISLTSNTGTITFADLDIAPDNNQRGFHATNNTGIITTTSGTIATSGQPAIEIIGMALPNQTPLNLTLTSVSVNGGTNGIVITNTSSTGSPGGFRILGNGGNCTPADPSCTGGTIQNTQISGTSFTNSQNISLNLMNFTNANTTDGGGAGTCDSGTNAGCNGAIKLNNVNKVDLDRLYLSGTMEEGINGINVTDLSLTNGTIQNAGNAVNEHAIYIKGLFGITSAGTANLISGNTISNAAGHNIFIQTNTATNASSSIPDRLVIQNNIISNPGSAGQSDGITVAVRDTGNYQTIVQNNTFNSTRTCTDAVQVDAGNTSRSDTVITGNHFQTTYTVGGTNINGCNTAINVSGAGTSNTTFSVTNNPTVQAGVGNAINIASNGDANLTGTISGHRNTNPGHSDITVPAGLKDGTGSASNLENNGFGIDMVVDQTGRIIANVDGNITNGLAGGIRATARNPGVGEVDLTLQNNTFNSGGAFEFYPVLLASGNGSGGSENNRLCVNLSNNQTSHVLAGNFDYWLEQWNNGGATNAFQLQGLSPASGATEAQVEAFVSSKDIGGAAVEAFGATVVNYTAATCATPPVSRVSESSVPENAEKSAIDPQAPGIEDILWAFESRRSEKANIPNLTEDQLQVLVQAAIERWRAAGISEEAFQRVTFEIAELPDGQLAAGTTRAVKISPSGAGFGWYLDPNPMDDSEFGVPVIGLERQSNERSPAFRQIDLLTAVTRALGNALSYENPELGNQHRWLMQNSLGAGIRRAPLMDWTQTDDNSNILYSDAPSESTLTVQSGAIPLVNNQIENNQNANKGLRIESQMKSKAIAEAGTPVSLNIGTLPVGKSVTITFNVLVNSPSLPLGTTQISNQGTVSGTNFSNVLTDDPAAGGGSDPTITPVDRPDTTVSSISHNGTDPTAASSVSWTVTFAHAAIGLTASNFTLVNSGLGATPAITSVAPVGMAPANQWTVTASTGTGSGTLGLNITGDAGFSHDVTNLTFTGQVFTIDRTPPDTTINTNPTNPTNTSSAAFTFSGTDTGGSNVASFECQLDGGGFATCTSTQNYTSLADGSHTFQVRAIDGVGNVDATAASFTWTIDTTAPDTSITSNPPAQSGVNVSFSFSGTDPGGTGVASFECQLDGGGFTACTSPKAYNSLADGSHTFQVHAIDAAGNVDASPASYTWNVDGTAPDTTIDNNPTNPSNSSSVSFTFSGSDPGGSGVASFECKLDAGVFAACTSPQNYTSLADGSHTFQVRAIDSAGNVDASPASYTWTIDATAPDTTITAQPTNPSGSNVSFSFTGNDGTGTGIASFECQLDGGGYSACTSPQAYNSLADGTHTFQVRAIDNAGNVDGSPASFTWTIDTGPPDTSITANPSDPSGANVSFSFTGTDAGSGVASFECQFDGGGFAACTSPKSYMGLAQGSHTFQVRAIDGVGNADPTPASFTWTVDTTAPDTTINSSPTNPSSSSGASFTFTGTDSGGSNIASFECKLDGGAFAACTSPQNYTTLSDGSHTFQVRAIDGVGNVDASPASYTWTIDATAPDTTITANPTNPSANNVSFSFTGSDPGGSGVASFECKLDAGAFAACTSPQAYNGLSDGNHTFMVRAIDGAGGVDPTPASFTWVVDTMPPDSSITANPGDPSGANVSFSFTGSDAGSGVASFECDLDGGGFTGCTSAKNYTNLPQGSHTFQVRAIDNVNNTDPTPASYTWNVDATAPDTTIDSSPPNPSNSGNASFTFSGTDSGGSTVVSFECSLDGGPFAACTSPQAYSSLADGSHTFQVRAIDGVGNVDATSASYTWVVDATGPETTITANPTNPSNSNSATFSFTGTDTGGSGIASFECDLDEGGFTACTSPKSYNSLADGSHIFQVRAIDNAGNADASLASFTWTVDTAPPDTSITANPTNPTNSTSASFTFSGTDSGTGVESFECKLDAGAFTACTSSQSYSMLSNGSHTFQVRAIDGIGNVDPTPASFTWTIDTTAPSVTINQAAGQPDPANGMGITIHFTAVFSEPVTGFGAGDVQLSGTAGATSYTITETGPMNGTTYNVAVSGMTMGGNVTASVLAGSAQDAATNLNTASTSMDNTVTYVPNTPPVANPDSYSTTQDTALTVAAPGVLSNDSDPDAGNTITAVLVSSPSSAQSFALNVDGSFNYNPTAGFTGTDSFTYKARDNFNAESSVVTVTISVKYRFAWVSNGMLGGGFTEQGLNQVTAGSNVALRFTLYGYKGDPYSQPPTSQPINCATFAPTGPATTINRFTPDPFYSSLYDFYQTTWQSQTAWKFTCRRLTLHFNDGTTRSLLFYFK